MNAIATVTWQTLTGKPCCQVDAGCIRVAIVSKAAKIGTLTDWTAFPLDVQPLLWGTVQIRTASLKVHPVTFYITIITSTCDTDFGAERLSMLEVLPIGETVGKTLGAALSLPKCGVVTLHRGTVLLLTVHCTIFTRTEGAVVRVPHFALIL